jgi:hypothetical protein
MRYFFILFLFCILVGCSNKTEFPDNIDHIVLQETNGDKIIVGCDDECMKKMSQYFDKKTVFIPMKIVKDEETVRELYKIIKQENER